MSVFSSQYRPTVSDLVFTSHKRQQTLSQAIYRSILQRDPCVYCGRECERHGNSPLRITIDHIVARANGGGSHWMNKAATCQRCNNHKARKDLLQFLLVIANTPPHRGC